MASADGIAPFSLREDEMAVLSEFTQLAPSQGYVVELLDAQAVQNRSAAVRPDALRGGL